MSVLAVIAIPSALLVDRHRTIPSLPIPASDVASFHVIGSKDKIRDDSKSISQAFDDRVVYHTPVGHELPGILQLE